ncbi:MAG: thiamine phosphate synthase [Treponema sp.]|jgi:thiamine-phosphate pyrophosphorylase|nr:thiamine phosphate synthase [Treponema sp.]
MFKKSDLALYLCTDRALSLGRPLIQAVEAAVQGGVTMVQLREKEASAGEFFALAKELLGLTRPLGIPLIINDRLDIALAAGAEGLHIGQSDLPLREARRIAGPGLIIGVSASTAEEALAAERDGADYIGAGAVFPTGSKADVSAVIGIDGLAAICKAVKIPVAAIGGIGPGNIRAVLEAGASGAAVISAILSQPDIREAAAALRRCGL